MKQEELERKRHEIKKETESTPLRKIKKEESENSK
jgi:hypothetical protein